jgi:hypothetical protein
VREVSDQFLLNMAEVSGTLIGLFFVGVFFYVETGLRHLDPALRDVFVPYLRAGTRIVLLLFALPLGLSLTLVVLGPGWNRVFFLLLSLTLVAANVETVLRLKALGKVGGSTIFLVNEVVGSAAVVVLVVLPWALGGFHPSREDLTWAILISFGVGFLSISALVLSVFDAATNETAA